ncbi:DsbA family protein [Salipiger mangrovisoli]|uniref:DsbA family protein n=1 Tax=Salipiger mangrovisoli TaxID=2865933 RepID=A0ABR9X742_9RHOB|nr:DsbA family protein [Salipiger mangrovisoli]MBE9639247.1 DsbA family protein [Salipiger mangrovisoli]
MTITRRNLLTGGAGVALIASSNASLARAQEISVNDVLNDPVGPVEGNPSGDVTIVEYFDYQCPFCKKTHPTVTDIVASDGNLRLVMKDWPIFGAPSVYASQLALGAVELGLHTRAKEALMATEGRFDHAQVDETLRAAAIDVEAVQNAYLENRAKWDGLLDRNSMQAAAMGLNGTPVFIIGRTLYPGALDRAGLEKAVEQARQEG